MTCPDCERLRDEVAYLRSELGIADESTLTSLLSAAYRLSPTQARILQALYLAKGRVVTKDTLRENFCTLSFSDQSNVVEAHVCHLRRKFGKDDIINIWGEGYRLTPEGVVRVADVLSVRRAA